jgi:hypothetical protein
MEMEMEARMHGTETNPESNKAFIKKYVLLVMSPPKSGIKSLFLRI